MQRDALRDLRQENARLRELLNLAGVDASLIETYLLQNIVRDDNSASLRQIRPKISLEASSSTQVGVKIEPSSSASASPRPIAVAHGCATRCGQWSRPVQAYMPATPSTLLRNQSPMLSSMHSSPSTPFLSIVSTENMSITSMQPDSQDIPAPIWDAEYSQPPQHSNTFFCPIFKVEAPGPLPPAEDNSVQCSLAREMIEAYNIGGQDLEEIKQRLATGFSAPAAPGESCRVNNQILFEILNDISSRLS